MQLDSSDRFEIKARAFRRMTGHLAPGKDRPAASGADNEDEIEQEWCDWNTAYGNVISYVLDATEIHLTD